MIVQINIKSGGSLDQAIHRNLPTEIHIVVSKNGRIRVDLPGIKGFGPEFDVGGSVEVVIVDPLLHPSSD